jgi:hypothetical protein
VKTKRLPRERAVDKTRAASGNLLFALNPSPPTTLAGDRGHLLSGRGQVLEGFPVPRPTSAFVSLLVITRSLQGR